MKSYLDLSHKTLSMNRKESRLTIISVIISVTLITGIFSMGDVFLRFEKLQVIRDYGKFHMALSNATKDEIDTIEARIDVKNSGRYISNGEGMINNVKCTLGSIDEGFAENIGIVLEEGSFPQDENQLMIERWATEDLFIGAGIGDQVEVSLPDGTKKAFTVSGVYQDLGAMKAKGVPSVVLFPDYAAQLNGRRGELLLVEFKDRVRIKNAVGEIKAVLNLEDGRVSLNDHLLAVIGQSEHQAATGIYTIGVILFTIVLAAGVVMIYNTFNISVMERVREFGLLRCVGAAKSQIKKLVKREGYFIALQAIPPGIILGMLMTFACSAVLKYMNNKLFGSIPLFTLSPIGIAMGIVTGLLTVFIAVQLPANKASRVSPVNAVTGSNEIRISKRRKRGYLTKVIHADVALGINNAVVKKRTLVLMSLSIAISITMFLGFNVLISFMHTSLKTTKPYTPDITIIDREDFSTGFVEALKEMNGVKRIYTRKADFIEATFAYSSLTPRYLEMMKGQIAPREDGMFTPVEKSWLISYDAQQLQWARGLILEGTVSEDELNRGNGLIAVVNHLRKGVSQTTANLRTGDKVIMKTPDGSREMTVMAVLPSEYLQEDSPELTMTTFITTERLFTELTGKDSVQTVHLQLKSKKDDATVDVIRNMADNTMIFQDRRQANSEMNQLFFTMALFVYGFVVVIALISLLNIMNTMNTSIASKSSYLGVMRAVGMTGKQLGTMIIAEAGTYSSIGIVAGCIIGVLLQKFLITNFLTAVSVKWEFPAFQLVLITVAAAVITAVSVIGPLRKIRSKSIVEAVNGL